MDMEHLWFRLLVASPGFLVCVAVYLLTRFGHRDLRRLKLPLLVLGMALLGVALALPVVNRWRFASTFQSNGLGFLCAHFWLKRRDPQERTQITTLGLSHSRSDEEHRR
jgi:hypothetical protein